MDNICDVYVDVYNVADNTATFPLKPHLPVGTQCSSTITGLSNGGFVVTWQSSGDTGDDGSDIYARRYDASGSAVVSQFKVNSLTENLQDRPAVAGLTYVGFVIVWESLSTASLFDIYAHV